MNSKNTKSSAELKREVMHELQRVENDIDRIQSRLTPGQLIDDAVFRNRSTRSSFEKLKENPVGTAFLTVGALLLMEDEQSTSFESRMKGETHQAVDLAKNVAESVSSNAESEFAEVKNKVQNEIQEKRDVLRNLDPLSYVALGAGLGALTGVSLPLMEKEQEFVDARLNEKFKEFKKDLQEALNQSANVVKNEFFEDFKDYSINFFSSRG